MDMNDIRVGDDAFDIYYSAFVLTYSPDVPRTLKEALRVTKPSGIHVFGWTSKIGEDRYGLAPVGSDIRTFAEFEAILQNNIAHVYWRDCYEFMDQNVYNIIYRIKK